mgnify:CR=1 FL=1|tara:strand:- start:1156 stop:2142 length:987 start_codon:yes stop_codon:yes gene_type:complete
MKKISEGNKGIQALAKENPALVEDKFGYDVPGYFMGGMPGYDEAQDEAQKDLQDFQNRIAGLDPKEDRATIIGEMLSMIGESSNFAPLVGSSKVAGIEAIIPKIRRPDPETLMPQGFRRGGMPGGLGSLYERDFITDDFNIKDYINNVLGGGTASQLTEEEQEAMRLAKGYGASGAMGGNAYRGTTPGADVTIDARSENPAVYKFYPSEVSKLYSQMKGVPFSPLVAPPKEATFIDALQPKKIASQLYAKDGTFVDRDELITGPGGERGDKIPAMLSDGEFVVNAAAVRGIGIQAGADPDDEYEQRLLGAREMYEMQKLGEEFAKKLA